MYSKRFSLCLILVVALVLLGSYAFSEESAVPVSESAINMETPVTPDPVQETAPVVKEEPVAETKTPEVAAPAVKVEAPKVMEVKPVAEETKELKWVWGEVSSVDAVNNKIMVKYLNYDSDAEETLNIAVDSATRFENAEGVNAVKVGDNVGVDYMLNVNGEAVAKSITLEKAESMPEKVETMPQAAPVQENIETPVAPEAASVPQVNAVEGAATK